MGLQSALNFRVRMAFAAALITGCIHSRSHKPSLRRRAWRFCARSVRQPCPEERQGDHLQHAREQLDEQTLDPRPNYWAAVLWKRLMALRSLDPGIAPTDRLRVYAQCMNASSGGVTLLVLNVDKKSETSLKLPVSAERYTLSSPDLFSTTVLLNGKELKAGADDTIPVIEGQRLNSGTITFAPLTITFLALPSAGNPQCRR